MRKSFDMGLHAAAHVEQQHYIHRHILAGKVLDFAGLPVFKQYKIFLLKTSDRAVRPIDYLRVNANQRNITAECYVVVSRRGHSCESGNQKNAHETGHATLPFRAEAQ